MALSAASSLGALEIEQAAEGFCPACWPLLGEVAAQGLMAQRGPAQTLEGGRHSWGLCAALFKGYSS